MAIYPIYDEKGKPKAFLDDEEYKKYKEEEKRNKQTLRFIEVVIAIIIVGIIMCTGSSKDDKQSATPRDEIESVQSSSLSGNEEGNRTYKKSTKSSNSITTDEIESEPASNSGTGFRLEKVDHIPLSSE